MAQGQGYWQKKKRKLRKRINKRRKKFGLPPLPEPMQTYVPATPGSKNNTVNADKQRAAKWVESYLLRHGQGPEWRELGEAMGWPDEPGARRKIIMKLAGKGWLTYESGVPRSLRPGSDLHRPTAPAPDKPGTDLFRAPVPVWLNRDLTAADSNTDDPPTGPGQETFAPLTDGDDEFSASNACR